MSKKVVIITGSARGIGAASVVIFCKHGYAVIGLDVLEEEGKAVCDQLSNEGYECTFVKCDISNETQVRETVNKITKKYGRVDVLVNVAGIVLVKPFDEITWEEYQRTTDVNLGGTFLLCKYVLPIMKQ